MVFEIIEQQINIEPVRIMLRNGIVSQQPARVTYIKKVVRGAQALRKNPMDFTSVDSSVLQYSTIFVKRVGALLDNMDADNLEIHDFENILKALK